MLNLIFDLCYCILTEILSFRDTHLNNEEVVEETLERTGQVELDRSVAEKEEAEIQKLQRGIDMTRLIIEEIPNREL